jgi:hypothetical protein
MKKILLLLAIVLIFSIPVTAGDFAFVFDGTETNPEFLFDFFPTYVRLGTSYTGFELIDGNITEVILIGSGGYGHTKVWTDSNGIPFDPGIIDIDDEYFVDLQSYNNILLGADFRLQQFLNPAIPIMRGDLAAYAEYGISWMHPLENGDASFGLDGSEAAYPDRGGALWNRLSIGSFLDAVEKGASPDGYIASIKVAFAPDFFANSYLGIANYSRVEASFVYYFPLLERTQANGLNLFALYLADRVAAHIVLGELVPQRVQKPVALGTLMRGFEKNSFGTRFTAVNNLEVRLAGPEIFLKNLYPRIQLFLDVGTYAGEYLNTLHSDSGFLASTGFEAALTVFNLVSVGYRGAFVLKGENMAGSSYVGGIMANLQF